MESGVYTSLTVKAEVDSFHAVKQFILGKLVEANCPKHEEHLILIAAEEVFANIVSYAYPDGEGELEVAIGVEGDPLAFVMAFSDSGTPFDPLERKEPDLDLALEERPVGGLGIYMVKRYMDEVDYRYQGGKNVLMLRKTIGK